MKIIAIVVVIMICVSFLYGFDFTIFSVDNLDTYPQLDFGLVVPQFVEASAIGIGGTFTIMNTVIDGASSILDIFIGGDEVIENETAALRYSLLVKYKKYLSLADRVLLSLVNLSHDSIGQINSLYEKYAFFIEEMERVESQ